LTTPKQGRRPKAQSVGERFTRVSKVGCVGFRQRKGKVKFGGNSRNTCSDGEGRRKRGGRTTRSRRTQQLRDGTWENGDPGTNKNEVNSHRTTFYPLGKKLQRRRQPGDTSQRGKGGGSTSVRERRRDCKFSGLGEEKTEPKGEREWIQETKYHLKKGEPTRFVVDYLSRRRDCSVEVKPQQGRGDRRE